MESNKIERQQGLAYDGRQLTIVTLNRLIEHAIIEHVNKEYRTCLTLYLSILNIVKKNIGDTNYTNIKAIYNKCLSALLINNLESLEYNICSLQEELMYSINHILMPARDTEDITEWDESDLAEGSD